MTMITQYKSDFGPKEAVRSNGGCGGQRGVLIIIVMCHHRLRCHTKDFSGTSPIASRRIHHTPRQRFFLHHPPKRGGELFSLSAEASEESDFSKLGSEIGFRESKLTDRRPCLRLEDKVSNYTRAVDSLEVVDSIPEKDAPPGGFEFQTLPKTLSTRITPNASPIAACCICTIACRE